MEHCKKLVLVPHETLSRLHEKPIARSDFTAFGELDSAMKKILHEKAEDSEKWKMYNQTLQRYLHFANEQRKPLEITLPTVSNESSASTATQNTDEDNTRLLTQLTTIIPNKFKHNAHALFESLRSQQARAQISWDAAGSVTINNTRLPQTSIIEIISDATRNRKSAQAVGWKEFASVLRELNTPLDLISNSHYKDFILNQRGSGVTPVLAQDASFNPQSNAQQGVSKLGKRRCLAPPRPRTKFKTDTEFKKTGRVVKRKTQQKGWTKWAAR